MATLNPNLKDFWYNSDENKFVKARNRILHGGRASSKSWEYAGRSAQIGQEYKTRFLCVRRYQNKIKDSVYTLIKNQISNFDLGGYRVLASSIEHINGTEFAFYGIERNTDEIKSFEGCDVLWIEEAHNLTSEQWEILEPTIRKEGSEIWISFNPRLISDFIWQRFIVNPPPNTIIRQVNYTHNPFLSSTLLSTINAMKDEDFEQYQHIYLGVPLSDDDQAVIKRSWLEAAIDAHIKLEIDMSGRSTVGYDVADSGEDKNAIAVFNGAICEEVVEWKAPEDELINSALKAWSYVKQGDLVYDSIGVGAHVGSTLNSKGHRRHRKFNAGAAVHNPLRNYAPNIKNKDKFENLKAQAWQDVAARLRNTFTAVNKGMKYSASELISISSDVKGLEALKTELCSPHKDYSKRGLDMVESKKDMAKRDIKSPNKADAFIMAACPHLSNTEARTRTAQLIM
ncbi:MAG: PBSX family phage terminase large subunit [Pseudoalteromonas sp.]|nr:PBSX family phage terminase large subunit [Pseudoalteromonas sp.]